MITLYGVYCPWANPKHEERFQNFWRDFRAEIRDFHTHQRDGRHLIIAGDLNIAASELDLKSATTLNSPGSYSHERAHLRALLRENNLIDTIRYLTPQGKRLYTAFSRFPEWRLDPQSHNTCAKRLDYVLCSKHLKPVNGLHNPDPVVC